MPTRDTYRWVMAPWYTKLWCLITGRELPGVPLPEYVPTEYTPGDCPP